MNQLKATDQVATPEHSTSELIKLVAEQVSVLVRDELKLAELEMARKGRAAGKGMGMLGGGGLVALYGVACLIACVIIALSHVLQAWLAALIVGAVLLLIAAIVSAAGRRRLKKATPPTPAEAVGSVKADVEAVRERARRS
jgi:Flp pilus assembly protein TadB